MYNKRNNPILMSQGKFSPVKILTESNPHYFGLHFQEGYIL